MKKITLFLMTFALLGLTSCDDEDAQVFNPSDGDLAYFTKATAGKLPIREENVTGSYFIEVGSTTKSNVDRQIEVSIITESTTADPSMYTIDPATLVIPAGEYVGKIKVSSSYAALPPIGETAVLALKLNSVDGTEIVTEQGSDMFALSMFKSCAIDNFPTTYNVLVSAFGQSAPSHVVNFVALADENTYSISSSWGPNFVAWATDDPSYEDSYYYPGTIEISCTNAVSFVGEFGSGTGTYDPGSGLITLTIDQDLFTGSFTIDLIFMPQLG
jgi:hypothetical protein